MSHLRIFVCAVTVLLFASVSGQAELRLVGHLEGRTIPVTGLENNQIVGLDGTQKRELPSETVYELEGDLKAEAAKILWSPSYSVYSAELQSPKKPGVLGIGQVSIRHMTEIGGKEYPSDFFASWPKESSDGGLMLVGWLGDGKVSRLAVKKVPSTKASKIFQIEQHFELLTDAEVNGQGILLLWSNGHFVTPSPRFADERTQLVLAAMLLGDIKPLRLALANGLKPSIKDEKGNTLLHFAAEAGAVGAVDMLLESGAKINALNQNDSTPIHLAASKGRLAAVERLLAGRANVVAENLQKNTALHCALLTGHKEVARTMLEKEKGDVNAINSNNRTPFSLVIERGYTDLASMMLEDEVDFSLISEQLPQLLIEQTAKGNIAMVRLLLGLKTDPRARYFVDPRARYSGRRAMTVAAGQGDLAIIEVLIGGGAHIDDSDSSGRTALMIACRLGRNEFFRALLDAGADVNLRARDGGSCLDYAVELDASELVELLLAKGADFKRRNKDQLSPLDLALLNGVRATAVVLNAHGATIDLNSAQAPALIEAALKLNVVGVIRSALAQGWSAETKLNGGWPALFVAQACRAADCEALLMQAGASNSSLYNPPLVSLTEIDATPKLVAGVSPDDPRDIDEGFPAVRVDVDVVLDGKGQVHFPVISAPADRRLALATLQAISNWRFNPITRGGEPVCIRFKVPVEFKASTELVVNSSQAELLPRPTKLVAPIYPKKNTPSKSGIGWSTSFGELADGGNVVLSFTVGKNGKVRDIRVRHSSDAIFDKPAIEALSQWLFEPGKYEGKVADIRMEQPFVFPAPAKSLIFGRN